MRSARLAFLLVAFACAPPGRYAPLQPKGIDASFGKTWDALIEVLAERNLPVRAIDRSSGFVSAEVGPVRSEEFDEVTDCGGVVRQVLAGTASENMTARYSVLVRGDSVKSTIKVSAKFIKAGDAPRECPSRNVFERELQSEVKSRAERR